MEEKVASAYDFDKNLVIAQKLSFKSATRTESDIVVLFPGGPRLFRDASVLFSSVNQSIQEQYFLVHAPIAYRDERQKRAKEKEFFADIIKMIEQLLGPGPAPAATAGGAK